MGFFGPSGIVRRWCDEENQKRCGWHAHVARGARGEEHVCEIVRCLNLRKAEGRRGGGRRREEGRLGQYAMAYKASGIRFLSAPRTGQGGLRGAIADPNANVSVGVSSWFSRGTPDARIHDSPPSIDSRIDSPVYCTPFAWNVPADPTATPSRLLGKCAAATPT